MSDQKSIFDRLRSFFGRSENSEKPAALQPSVEQSAQTLPRTTGRAGTSVPLIENESPSAEITGRSKVPKSQTLRSVTPPVAVGPQGEPAPEVDLTLGIDFGTSCTKVVIGDHGWLGQSYAVPVGIGINGLERFLRATQVAEGGTVEANLKMRLMEKPDSVELRDLAALYLAGVIRDSLAWFSAEKAGRYKGRTEVWSLNLGFAAKQNNDGPLAPAYKEIANLAAELGPSDHPLSIASVRRLRTAPAADSPIRIIPANRIALYPEIAAQLAGYVNSPYRAQGNLILIDVGAGTLDVSTAILHGNRDEDIVSFHVCEVKPLGALKLLEARISAIEEVSPGSVPNRLEDYQSGTVPIPESVPEIIGRQRVNQTCIEAFEKASSDFADDAVRLAIACASRFRKLQRDAHANASFDPWPGQLRFFFTGGGSRLAFYRRLFVQGRFEQELSRYTRWKETPEDRHRYVQGLRHEPLPAPPDLQGLPYELTSDFDRLSVAHGLAYGCENLMKITASVHS
jgi:hypothetical protein